MSEPLLLIGVAAAGAIGAPTRYLVDRAIQRRTRDDLPYGTLTINVTGSFILGLLTALSLHHRVDPTAFVLAGSGFCGAYTTFSTFAFETARLAERTERGRALGYVTVSVVAGTSAAALGWLLVAVT